MNTQKLGNEKESRLLEIANRAIIKSEFIKAKDTLLELVKEFPYTAKYYSLLGFVYEQLGEKLKAVKMRIESATLDKSGESEWRSLLSASEELKDTNLVEKCCSKLLKLAPNDFAVAKRRLEIFLSSGQTLKAIDCYCEELDRLQSDETLSAGLSVCAEIGAFERKTQKSTCKEELQKSTKDEENEEMLEMSDFDADLRDLEELGLTDAQEDFGGDMKQFEDFDYFEDFGKIEADNKVGIEEQQNSQESEKEKTATEVLQKRKKAVQLLEHYFGANRSTGIRPLKISLFELEHLAKLFELYVSLEMFVKIDQLLDSIPAGDRRYLPREVWVAVAISNINLGVIGEIDETLKKCGLFDQPEEAHCLSIGTAFLRKEMPKEASKYLSVLKEKKVCATPKIWYLLGYCAFLLKNFGESEEYLKKVLNSPEAEDGDQMNSRLCLSKIYKAMKKSDAALEILKLPQNLIHLAERNKQSKRNKRKRRIISDKFGEKSRLETRKTPRLLHKLELEKERDYLINKLELVSEEVAKQLDRADLKGLVENTKAAMDDLLFSQVNSAQFFSFKRFPPLALVLARVWSLREFFEERTEALAKLTKTAAEYLTSRQDGKDVNIGVGIEIALTGAKRLLKTRKLGECFKGLRAILIKRPYDFGVAKMFAELIRKSGFNKNYMRFVVRLSKARKKSLPVSYLMAFCSIKTRSYIIAVSEFLKCLTLEESPAEALLYIGCCYILESNKRSCLIKDYLRTLGIAVLKKYSSRLDKSALAMFNLAECYYLMKLESQAFLCYEKVLTAKDLESPKSDFFVMRGIHGIEFITEYNEGEAFKRALDRLNQINPKYSKRFLALSDDK